jgi:hypothetical protein
MCCEVLHEAVLGENAGLREPVDTLVHCDHHCSIPFKARHVVLGDDICWNVVQFDAHILYTRSLAVASRGRSP